MPLPDTTKYVVATLLALTSAPAIGLEPAYCADSAQLPIVDETLQWPTLGSSLDPYLVKELVRALGEHPRWLTLARGKRLAVGIVDLEDIHHPRTAWVNGDLMMYAASLPKIAVLLAAMESIEDGSLPETPDLVEDMHIMIRNSDNAATTRTIDRIGLKRIEQVVTSPRYQLFNPKKGGGLWVGKRYAKAGTRNPDPLQGLSHAATVSQVCRFYYLLATGRLVSPERSRQMLKIMAYPHIYHKFVSSLKDLYPLSRIFRKSGTWKTWHSDSVLLWSEDGSARCIMVALVEDAGGESILRALLPVLLGLVKH